MLRRNRALENCETPMARDNGRSGKTQLAAILAHLTGDAARFAETVLGHGALDGADALDPADMATDVREVMAFIADKPVGRHKIRVRAAAGGSGTLVEMLNDDMPFLVDSVMGEIQARGLPVKLVVHPIYKTSRTPAGRLISILGAADQHWADGRQESLIAVYLDPLPPDAASELGRALSDILGEVRAAVTDWPSMVARVDRAIVDLGQAPAPKDLKAVSLEVLKWLRDGHFTFLGVSELRFESDGALKPVDGSALGLLRDPNVHVLRQGDREIAISRDTGGADPSPLVISKASAVSRVHRRVHMDYIAVKTYDGKSAIPTGEVRIVGLLTSKAYTQTAQQIPLLNHKIESVLAGSGYPAQSHAGKALVNILDTFPRDELFQIETDDLAAWSQGILDLDMRPRVRVFARPDRFGRFISVLLYAPRDRWTTDVREKIGALLSDTYNGHIAAFHPYFMEGPLLRAQFIVATPAGSVAVLDAASLEPRIAALMRTWGDQLSDHLKVFGADASTKAKRYNEAFPPAYTDTFDAARAIEDIRRIERLNATGDAVSIDFFRAGTVPKRINAAISRFGDAIRLSERVPVLENLGFSVIDERSFALSPRIGNESQVVALHHMQLETADGAPLDLTVNDTRLEDGFRAVLRGVADNDLFNRLIIAAGANWREAALLRTYGSYLRQLNAPFGLRYLAETLTRHAGVARDMIELFHIRFDPDRKPSALAARKTAEQPVRERIDGALANVPSLDEDRILRLYLNLIDATVRTNFYQFSLDGQPPELIALKFDSKVIDVAPQPKPYREIWVYSPRVEGVHLRFAPIARGGIRWSDRAQDFRTEVLGLVKAQLVKNAVIVPSGAKGGFLPKQLPRGGNRDDIMKEGIAAYCLFISALLDITDNIIDGEIIPPARVVRYDNDDPYLVVAADKGTATFSDFANAISAAHNHWLGDAFASGGSVGYDHKKMAITARGGWECVKRHFREIDWDIQTKPFRVTGVGDMSGDVFGNGMLLSPAIQLVAAFDHRDIFIDPSPSAATSFAERQRLFDLPRSSWQDYDKTKISSGGGVYARSAKSITVSVEMKALLRLETDTATPAELMRAILRCDTDLIWFGGIGTYVRATAETDEQVGDRANDAIRVSAAELGAKVVGEGANLGLTQRGRVELAQRGVRLNTDFIDNSAGVNSSDLEVNIKISVGRATQSGELNGEKRAAFLATMTKDVAAACLVNNYQQSLALSLMEQRSSAETRDLARLMRHLERRKLLDRRLEALPGDSELMNRQTAGKPLTRPELALLLSYSKIALTEDLLASQAPDATSAASLLTAYMPPRLNATYAADVTAHRLKREIIATAMTNAVINRAGPAVLMLLADETGRSTADVSLAYLAAAQIFDLDALWRRIDALDAKISGRVQLEMYLSAQCLLRSAMRDLLREGRIFKDFQGAIAVHGVSVQALVGGMQSLPDAAQSSAAAIRDRLINSGAPAELAATIAQMPILADAPAITRLASETKQSPLDTAKVFLSIGSDLCLGELKSKAASLSVADEFDALAIGQAVQQLNAAQAGFTRAALAASKEPGEAERWQIAHAERVAPVRAMLDQITAADVVTVSRLVVAATRLRELADAPTS